MDDRRSVREQWAACGCALGEGRALGPRVRRSLCRVALAQRCRIRSVGARCAHRGRCTAQDRLARLYAELSLRVCCEPRTALSGPRCTMMHAWRNARTAAPSQRALASASSRSAVTLLHWRPLLSAAPRSWLLHSSRGFASKNPFGRGGVARAENPWGSSSRRATNATHAQQQHPPPQPPPRNERGANRSSPGTRNSESGARGAWATRSRDGSGSAGSGGKKHYQPRTLGAAAAAANPRPKTEARSATNANGPAWAPVAAKFAEATAWTPAPQKAWSRGGGTKQSETSAQPSSSAGAQSWARSAARRERSHGVSLPDLSAPAPTQPPAGSHKRGSRPTAEGRSSYRHGGERDARSKMRERERERYPSSSAASTLSSDPSSSSTDASRPSRSSPRSFEQTADLEEDTQEHVESTKSAAEFWTHFPSVSNAVKKGATTGSSSAAQVPQRLVPLPPEPEQYKPVFLNHPASSSNAAPPAAATNAASRSRSAPAPAKAKVRGSELNELMGSSIASVSLNRSTLRLGVLLPEPPPADIGFVDPEAPPPSEAERALEAFHAGVRLRIEGMSQELASATGAELVTHPLHVDMCAEFVPMDRQDVTGGTATIAAAPAPASGSSASSTLPPDPLLVLQLFESSIRHAPSSHRGHLRIRADASTGQASGVRGTALKGQGFFPSFFDYFRHAAARVHRDASEAKLMARNAMIRAVGWKPAQDNIAAAEEAEEEEEGEEDDEATTDAEAEQAAQSESPKESASAHAASASSTPASATPSKTFAGTSASSKPKSRRLRLRNVSTQLPQPLAGLTVMDATAGFGVDAFALAMVSRGIA